MLRFIKIILKFPFFYNIIIKIIGLKQSRVIKKEENIAQIAANLRDISVFEYEIVYSKLVEKLSQRNITWPPNRKNVHIVFASLPGNWERHNIPPQIEKIAKCTCYYPRDRGIDIEDRLIARKLIDEDFYRFIVELHHNNPVDMLISYFSGAEISFTTIEKIKHLGIATFSFHWDDRLYFYGKKLGDQWSGPAGVCKAYDLNLTNAPESLLKYSLEDSLVAFWPEAANIDFYVPESLDYIYDVSFIGAKYGVRESLITYLQDNGINVAAFGPGWSNGKLSPEDMVKIYNQSRINLGFGYIGFTKEQCLKGRDFEVPSCGALYLTSDNINLHKIYNVGQEICTYKDIEDCLHKIKFLLSNPELCSDIRKKARKKVLNSHSWQRRVGQLLFGVDSLKVRSEC